MDKQAEIARIKAEYEARNREIDRQHRQEMAKIIGGGLLQGASFHPIFNIPYVGTGLGGAMFEAGNAIMQGKGAKDIAKDAGKGFVIGETVGAIPYVGKVAGKTKAGQAVANQASNFANRLAETKIGQKVAEIAPKVEDALMTDIKAFNPFKQTQTAYHGSPYKFDKFSNEAIGTGEGAQAHGYGHYAAKSKDIAEKRYANNPTRVVYEGKATPEIQNHPDLFDDILTKGKESIRNKYLEDLELMKDLSVKYPDIDDYDRLINHAQNRLNIIDNIDESKLSRGDNGFVYKLSIPKDDVMLREDLPLSQQPIKVQEVLRDYFNQNPLQKHERRFFEDIENPDLLETTTGGNLYRQIARNVLRPDKNMKQREANAIATQILQDKGIKGISYNGGIDGEARVIFNPDDIEIVRKYYNQPNLSDIMSKNVNMGTFINALLNEQE